MAIPTRTSVSESQIGISWTPLTAPDNGDSEITSYIVLWDNGAGSVTIELLDELTTSRTITGLTGGKTYQFKVKAVNIYGEGTFSPILSVVASDFPDKPGIPSVTIGASDVAVTVDWVAPDSHSSTIDGYEILL